MVTHGRTDSPKLNAFDGDKKKVLKTTVSETQCIFRLKTEPISAYIYGVKHVLQFVDLFK